MRAARARVAAPCHGGGYEGILRRVPAASARLSAVGAHARALVGAGGLLWRVALHYEPPDLLQSFLQGPSVAASLYGIADADVATGSVTDVLSAADHDLVLGTCIVLKQQIDHAAPPSYMWPPDAELLPHRGTPWIAGLEAWFVKRTEEIAAGTARPMTAARWRQMQRPTFHHNPGSEPVPLSAFEETAQAIREAYGADAALDGVDLSEIQFPEQTRRGRQ